MADVRLPSGSFQDQSVAFQVWKYTRPIKDANRKGKFKGMLVFLFVDKRKIFVSKLSLEEFNTVFFTRSSWPVSSQPSSEVLEEISGTFCTLWSRKVRFQKGIFVFIKVSYTFCTFWHRRERKLKEKLQNVPRFETDFMLNFAMFSANFTWVNDPLKLVLRELQSRINLWVFE